MAADWLPERLEFNRLDLGFTRFAGDLPLYRILPKDSPNPEMVLEFLKYIQKEVASY
jgi:hypothetical protein